MPIQTFEVSSDQRDEWDREMARFEAAHPFNSFGWGRVRTVDGWTPHHLMAKDAERVRAMVSVFRKRIPGTRLSFMYAPRGPVYVLGEEEGLGALLGAVRRLAEEENAIFLRIEPNIAEGRFDAGQDPFEAEGFLHLDQRWSFWNSPRDVYRIDLSLREDEEELFRSLDKDARRCVRKSQREGLLVRPAESLEELRTFYDIFRKFSVDRGFMSRKLEYQESLWREFLARGRGRLFLAVYEGRIVGGLICLMFGRKCVAMHMGALHAYQRLQPFYAFIWESIRWSKQEGCEWYSFRGVGTTPTQESFKRKFGPQVVPLVGYYDLPFNPLLHRIFLGAEWEALPRAWPALIMIRKGIKGVTNRLGQAR